MPSSEEMLSLLRVILWNYTLRTHLDVIRVWLELVPLFAVCACLLTWFGVKSELPRNYPACVSILERKACSLDISCACSLKISRLSLALSLSPAHIS